MPRRIELFLLVIFSLSASLGFGQITQSSPADVEARANSLLKQLTLEEKIDLLGGVDDFYIHDIKHIGLPRLKMADGPIGVRNYGPSTVFGGIGLAATWDPELASRRSHYRAGRSRARRSFHARAGRKYLSFSA
jgi:beta-glucosidase